MFILYICQVCNLVWSKNVNELVSTHGYSQNQIIVWRYPTMSKVYNFFCGKVYLIYFFLNLNTFYHSFCLLMQLATLTGHTYRVLYLAISPDGQVFYLSFHLFLFVCDWVTMIFWLWWFLLFQTIVTGAGDETLRFWNVFPSPKSQVNCSLKIERQKKMCYPLSCSAYLNLWRY